MYVVFIETLNSCPVIPFSQCEGPFSVLQRERQTDRQTGRREGGRKQRGDGRKLTGRVLGVGPGVGRRRGEADPGEGPAKVEIRHPREPGARGHPPRAVLVRSGDDDAVNGVGGNKLSQRSVQ